MHLVYMSSAACEAFVEQIVTAIAPHHQTHTGQGMILVCVCVCAPAALQSDR